MTTSGCYPDTMGLGRIRMTPRDLVSSPGMVRRVATLAFAPPGSVALFPRRR